MTAQVTIPNTLSDEEKLYGLSKFWQEVNYNFAYFAQVPDLDWDKAYREYIPKVLATENDFEYYRLMQQFCALLKDGHTNVFMPRRVDSLQYSNSFGKYRFILTNIDNKAIVTRTVKGTMDEIPLGSEVIEVDGLPTKEHLEKNVFPYISSSTDYIIWDNGINRMLRGFIGDELSVKIKTPKGEVRHFDLKRESCKDEVIPPFEQGNLLDFEWKDNEVAYIALNSFGDPKIDTLFEEKLPELRKAKAMIIDLRKNGGGSTTVGTAILKYLTKDRLLYGSKYTTRQHIAAYKAWGAFTTPKDTANSDWEKRSFEFFHDNVWYDFPYSPDVNEVTAEKIVVPTVVLFGHNTASAAEDFLIYAERQPHFLYMGEPTFGSTGQPFQFQIPGDCWVRVCTKKDTYPDGREFVGYGIPPDIVVTKTVQDYLDDRDPVLEMALKALQSKEMMAKGKTRAEKVIAKVNKETLQKDAQKEINEQVWQPFMTAYKTLDADLYNSIHSPDVLRATRGGLRMGEEYRNSNSARFARQKAQGDQQEISFSFEHRLSKGDTAYEVGYYKLKYISNEGTPQYYYGRFHVVLKKINGEWKIAQDWDTNNIVGHEVGETDFAKGKLLEFKD